MRNSCLNLASGYENEHAASIVSESVESIKASAAGMIDALIPELLLRDNLREQLSCLKETESDATAQGSLVQAQIAEQTGILGGSSSEQVSASLDQMAADHEKLCQAFAVEAVLMSEAQTELRLALDSLQTKRAQLAATQGT